MKNNKKSDVKNVGLTHRSKHYDWFKNQSGNDKKDPKSVLKLIWKFTKIFSLIALIAFTLTGCVQSLTIKTDTEVGKGVEFYSSSKEISPHVTRLTIEDSSDTNTPDIYKLVVGQKNSLWVNEQDKLDSIRQEINSQKNENQKPLTLQDASKGGNEGVQIRGNIETETPVNNISNDATGPLVLSSKAVSAPWFVSGSGSKLTVTQIWDYQSDQNIFHYNFDKLNPSDIKQEFLVRVINQVLAQKLTTKEGLPSNQTVADWINKYAGSKPTTFSAQNQAANAFLSNLFKYAGINVVLPSFSGAQEGKISFVDGFTPGMGVGKTDYRPLATWGAAWKNGPFYGLFVYPIATVTAKMIDKMPSMNGWEAIITIFVIVFTLRIFGFLISFKSTLQQTKTQELQAKKAVIDAKYAPYKGNKQMEQRQRQEVSDLYKKEGIKPLSQFSGAFITMPIFLAMWRVLGAIPHIKSTVWLDINFSATSYKELFSGELQYLPLLILAAIAAGGQQLLPILLSKRRDRHRINVHQKAAMKKNNKITNIMMIFSVFMSVIFSAGMQIYWITGGIWMVIQSFITHHFLIWDRKRKRNKITV